MKRALLILLLISGAILGYKVYLELQKPAEGIVLVTVEPTEEAEQGTDETVPTETTTDTLDLPVEETEEVVEEEVEEVEEVFNPLPFTGKRLKAFAKKYGGRIVVVGGLKTVQIGDDYYYKKGDGLYVRHNGVEIKLN